MVIEVQFDGVFEDVMMNSIVAACGGDGVTSGLDVSERAAGLNMSVDVAAGGCIVNNVVYTESGVTNVSIAMADVTHPRKDLVYYDTATSAPLVVTGSPLATPIPPDIPSGDIALAIVNVPANASSIANNDITDCIAVVLSDQVLLNGSRAMEAALDLGAHKITGVVDPTSAQDAATQNYVTSYVASYIAAYKLDDLATPDDNTDLNSSTARHGLLPKLAGGTASFLRADGSWAAPSGAGDMTKAVYDPNADGVIALAQLDTTIASQSWVDAHNWAASDITSGTLDLARIPTGIQGKLTSYCSYRTTPYSHPSYRACTSGNWAWSSITGAPTTWAWADITGKPSTYTPSSHGNTSHSPAFLEVDGSQGLAANLLMQGYGLSSTGGIGMLSYSTSSVTLGNSSVVFFKDVEPYSDNSKNCGKSGIRWANVYCTTLHQGDCAYAEKSCSKCGIDFVVGDNIIHRVISIDDDTVTIPIHLECANLPQVAVKLPYAVKEDFYELDDTTGDVICSQRTKHTKKTKSVKHLKPFVELDENSGKLWAIDENGDRIKVVSKKDGFDIVDVDVDEVVYADKEFMI